MKKLILILSALTFGLTAQVVTLPKSAATMVNTTAVTSTIQTNSASESIMVQAIVAKSTGTVDGSIRLAGSIDGVNYVSFADTLILTDIATNVHAWTFASNNYLYYRTTFTGKGTLEATPTSYLFLGGKTNQRAAVNMLSPTDAVSATTTDAGTSFVSLPVSGWYNTIAIQSVVTKVSGTVAGTVTLQGSLDGVNYKAVIASVVNANNYTPTNVTTNSFIFTVTGSPYRFYRLSYTGAGTMAATHRGYVLPSRK